MKISDTGKYIKIDLSDEKLDKHVFKSLIVKEFVENIMEDKRIYREERQRNSRTKNKENY